MTIEDAVRQQVACELEKSMLLKDPGGWPDYDEITEAINRMDNANFLRIVSDSIEALADARQGAKALAAHNLSGDTGIPLDEVCKNLGLPTD